MGFKKGNKVGKTFQPGETGNPDGRPVGAITFKSIAERLLDGKINIEQAGEMRQISRANGSDNASGKNDTQYHK